MPMSLAAMVLVAAGSATLKPGYYNDQTWRLERDGQPDVTIKRDYYNPDSYVVEGEGKRGGTLKRDYYDPDRYRYVPRRD